MFFENPAMRESNWHINPLIKIWNIKANQIKPHWRTKTWLFGCLFWYKVQKVSEKKNSVIEGALFIYWNRIIYQLLIEIKIIFKSFKPSKDYRVRQVCCFKFYSFLCIYCSTLLARNIPLSYSTEGKIVLICI